MHSSSWALRGRLLLLLLLLLLATMLPCQTLPLGIC
jgi:hypothetical protein